MLKFADQTSRGQVRPGAKCRGKWGAAHHLVILPLLASFHGTARADALPDPSPAASAGATTRLAHPRAPSRVSADDLMGEVRLEQVVRIALAQNPEIAEVNARTRAFSERSKAVSHLPDPEFQYQLWSAPLARPYALDEAQMHMFGLSQTFPAPGTLDAQSRAVSEQAKGMMEARRTREQDLIARVHRTFAEYYRADREYAVHLEHAQLAQQILEITRATYQAGRGNQQDILRVTLEVARLHNDVAMVERDRRRASGLLNMLMARAPEAPLGPPAAIDPLSIQTRLARLGRLGIESRPEIAEARSAIRVSQSARDGARAQGRWPSFMVGAQYMLAPMMEEPHNYGVMFSMSLPWLNAAYDEQARAAEADVAAGRNALSNTENAARYELYDALSNLEAARTSFEIIERDVIPKSRQSFEAARAAYRGGQGDSLGLLDALRSLLDIRIERERALARFASSLADVERASGKSKLASSGMGK